MINSATKQSIFASAAVDCFAGPVIGRRVAPTCWLAMTRTYSSPCTFGISCVGWICGAAGFASTVVGAATRGAVCGSAGFACADADCCAGAGAGWAASGFASLSRGGAVLGKGTEGVRLATCGTGAGGRGGPRTALTGGNEPVAP